MKKKQRERKQKKREAEAKQRVLNRRKKIREIKKSADEAAHTEQHFRVKQAPHRNDIVIDPEKLSADDPRKVEYIKQRLEHNMKILEALEEEMRREEETRKTMNESMEEKGALTLRDKLDMAGAKTEDFAGVKDWSNMSTSEEISTLPPGFSLDNVEAFMAPKITENN